MSFIVEYNNMSKIVLQMKTSVFLDNYNNDFYFSEFRLLYVT
jgi:hypothetical protein